MDCSIGKSESSIHPFNHSQGLPIEHNRMHTDQSWLIAVEEDLFLTSFIRLYQSKRMMMPLHCHSSYHRNTHYQTQWIEEKSDLTMRMMWYNGKHHHPVWLIEVEEDLFLTPFFQLYQSTRMMMLQWNNHHQTQWIEEKWDLTSRMIRYYGMLHYPVWLIEVEEDLWIQTNPSIKPVNENNGAL